MSKVSALIKLCKVKKMPSEVEDLIFEYLQGNKKKYLQVNEGRHLLSKFYTTIGWGNDFTEKIRGYILAQMNRYLRKETDFYNKFYLNCNDEFKVIDDANMTIEDFDDSGELSKENWALINMANMVLHC